MNFFFTNAHDILSGFPRFQPRLRELSEKRVGCMALMRKLGEGSFGSVYKFESEMSNVSGAVKVFSKSRVSSINNAMQIATELALLGRLKHKHVVQLFGAAHGKQSVYLFMELVGTRNLYRVMRAEGVKGLPVFRAAAFFSQIAAGVDHCHKMQVAHCDLKPENIVVSEFDCAKIVDFGGAVDLSEDVNPLQGPVGSIPFMAPEIMCSCPYWEPAAADVWSLAVTVVEILCGIHAFDRLLGWTSHRGEFKNPSRLAHRAKDLQAFFAKDETNSHESALMAISALCRDVPPPPLIDLLGNMLEFMPKDRILAESAAERIENISMRLT